MDFILIFNEIQVLTINKNWVIIVSKNTHY